MLDHVFISVSDLDRSIAFYTRALAPLVYKSWQH
ncbi:VOC family protein [Streptomyces sp. SID13031]|nr:VOC family protein [Streptomyces sp. SID13031]